MSAPLYAPWRLERLKYSGVETIHVTDATGRAVFEAVASDESNAKAALVVAAPVMLDALQKMPCRFAGRDSECSMLERPICPRCIAIAKAEGRS